MVTAGPPEYVRVGSGFGVTVTAENADGSINTSFSGDVTLTLNDDYGVTGTLGGTVTVAAVNGVATFTGLTVDQAGEYYSLTANASGPFPPW